MDIWVELTFVQANNVNQKFLIKIHISTISIQSKGNIASELIWLEALVKDTNLVVPVPVRNLQGDLVTEILTDLRENTIMVTIGFMEAYFKESQQVMKLKIWLS
ncbi:hypothetical protein [Paenibacillus sp. FSL E2-0151]|uniref:hypothetical protein n=1 Tax=Paenibacillus sp. FSL E2-0151 TaxID=2921357 RepID=UPI0030ED3E15